MNKKKTQKSVEKPLPMKRLRIGKIATAQEVAKFQARLIKKSMKGDGGVVNDCYKICTMASMLARTLETSDLERRIESLEEQSHKGKPS